MSRDEKRPIIDGTGSCKVCLWTVAEEGHSDGCEIYWIQRQLAECRAVLRSVEWGRSEPGHIRECPACGCPRGGIHATTCALNACLPEAAGKDMAR